MKLQPPMYCTVDVPLQSAPCSGRQNSEPGHLLLDAAIPCCAVLCCAHLAHGEGASAHEGVLHQAVVVCRAGQGGGRQAAAVMATLAGSSAWRQQGHPHCPPQAPVQQARHGDQSRTVHVELNHVIGRHVVEGEAVGDGRVQQGPVLVGEHSAGASEPCTFCTLLHAPSTRVYLQRQRPRPAPLLPHRVVAGVLDVLGGDLGVGNLDHLQAGSSGAGGAGGSRWGRQLLERGAGVNPWQRAAAMASEQPAPAPPASPGHARSRGRPCRSTPCRAGRELQGSGMKGMGLKIRKYDGGWSSCWPCPWFSSPLAVQCTSREGQPESHQGRVCRRGAFKGRS